MKTHSLSPLASSLLLKNLDIKAKLRYYMNMNLKGRLLIIISLTVFAVFLFISNFVFALLAGVGAYLLPAYLKNRKIKAFKEIFREQLIDGIEMIAGALKSGMTFQQALVYVIKETKEPISSELKVLMDKIMLGVTADKAMLELAEKHKLEELNLLSSAIGITREAGGNLAEILKNLSAGMREKVRLEGQIRTLTAQGKLSGLIVGCLPVVLLLIMYIMDKELVRPMFTSFAGIVILLIACVLELIGALIIKKIVTIDT